MMGFINVLPEGQRVNLICGNCFSVADIIAGVESEGVGLLDVLLLR